MNHTIIIYTTLCLYHIVHNYSTQNLKIQGRIILYNVYINVRETKKEWRSKRDQTHNKEKHVHHTTHTLCVIRTSKEIIHID